MILNPSILQRRSLRYYWRAALAVTLGAAAGAAALTGALFVGDSMRASLRAMAVARLGPVDFALEGRRFFREALAAELAKESDGSGRTATVCPVITVSAAISHAGTATRVNRIQVLGVDERFWGLYGSGESFGRSGGRGVALNAALAEALGAIVGDDVLVRVEKHGDVPVETLLGRRDDTIATLRLTVEMVIPTEGPGAFALRPGQLAARNAYVPMVTLQRALKQEGRVNTLLVSEGMGRGADTSGGGNGVDWQELLAKRQTLEDLELRLRVNEREGYASLESVRLLIESPVEDAAKSAAEAAGLRLVPILTYLANSISCSPVSGSGGRPDRVIPYSTVTAFDAARAPQGTFVLTDGGPAPVLGDREILLNEWAATELDAKPDDTITLTYFVSRPGGGLEERSSAFTLRGVVRMSGWGADAGLTPTFEGITDAKRISDWDPPFPFDMKRIRPKDEDYWDAHKALPKAFVSPEAGRRDWNADGRFGSYTAIRILPQAGGSISDAARTFAAGLLKELRPAEMGLRFTPVRADALAAGEGSTDFGQLFIGFSSFLIIAAAMLVALLFRLNVERRAVEVGLLSAVGISLRQVGRILAGEGAWVTVVGSAAGLLLAGGYAWLMLAGLRSWWSAAVNAPFLTLAMSPASAAIGFFASMAIAMISIVWAVRGLARSSPAALLSGTIGARSRWVSPRRRFVLRALAVGFFVLSGSLSVGAFLSDRIPQAPAFFSAGFSMLVALLLGIWLWLLREPRGGRAGPIQLTPRKLALRNARRQPARSLLAVGLVACATFVVVAVGASRKSPDADAARRSGGTGGYSLMAESVAGLPYDPATAEGRASLGLGDEARALCGAATIMSFRLKPGDDASCLNLYRARQPRILGARGAFIERGGFRFSTSLAASAEERANPWMLLNRRPADGAIAAIGDESAVRWLLHLGLGDDLPIADERGGPARLHIVGMLSGSVLQGELIISEENFLRLFPSVGGYGAFLIDVPGEGAARLEAALEKDLTRYGMDVEASRERLRQYLAVENTYLSTFQTLGGLGLLLGTIGLAAVMLRNTWERRGETALMRALGLRAGVLFRMGLAEHVSLLLAGLGVGTAAALLAVMPHAIGSPGDVPWGPLALTLLTVFATGTVVGGLAIRSTLRTPVLMSLRKE
ncbi:MAG: hypothetical protein DCC65_12080 [Planctomycetota bacterium]|nr:MAG: hypothetical protein DCC65_12080 [Planctomycetota bacterium]